MTEKLNNSFLTALSTDSYLDGVLTLHESLKATHSKYPFIVMIPEGLADNTTRSLEKSNIRYIKVKNDIKVDDKMNTESVIHWSNTFFKLKIVTLTEFDKIVYLDCDMIVLQNIDELFDLPAMTAVAAGRNFPGNEDWDRLNSGLMVILPEKGLSDQLISNIDKTIEERTKLGYGVGDQDVFNTYYADWRTNETLHLSEQYNMFYEYIDHYLKQGTMKYKDIKVVHFIGSLKPWNYEKSYPVNLFFHSFIRLCFGRFRAFLAFSKFYHKAVHKNKRNQ